MFLWLRIEPLLARFLVTIEKRAEATTRLPSTQRAEESQIPPDLLHFAQAQGSAWAREDAKKVIREMYEELGDWNKVRRSYLEQMSPYPTLNG